MKKEHTDYLEQVYPELYANENKYGGFAIGDGWFHIIDKLSNNIKHHLQWKANNRKRDLEMLAAKEQGYNACLKLMQGKADYPSVWDEERAMELAVKELTVQPEIPPVVIEQIKEKFGSLRFYYSGGDEYISGLVSMAESMAGVTCEDCGDVGESRNGGWIRVLCDKHEAEHQERIKLRNQNV